MKIEKYLTYIGVLAWFNATVLTGVLSLSVFRYVVFIAQYYLWFNVFKVEIDWWQTFWSISVVFLVITVMPGVADGVWARWDRHGAVRPYSANVQDKVVKGRVLKINRRCLYLPEAC